LRAGKLGPEDPQYGAIRGFPAIQNVSVLSDNQTLTLGAIAMMAHFTPGHTPGGTSWTWDSCESGRCLHMAYADSLTAIGAPGFLFNRSPILAGFEKSFAVLESLPCDIFLSPHPEVNNFWQRIERREQGAADALVDRTACRRYADTVRAGLKKRLASEMN
jgi:metallo-beta-lactamase class B